jgi:hypothetical protein
MPFKWKRNYSYTLASGNTDPPPDPVEALLSWLAAAGVEDADHSGVHETRSWAASSVGRTEPISSHAAIGRQHRALARQRATVGWAWLEPSHPSPVRSMESRGRALEWLSETRLLNSAELLLDAFVGSADTRTTIRCARRSTRVSDHHRQNPKARTLETDRLPWIDRAKPHVSTRLYGRRPGMPGRILYGLFHRGWRR